jgi:hypothetical protein
MAASIVVLPLLAVGVTALLGAGRDDDRVPAYPVQGRLLVGGKPAAGAQIAFHPLSGRADTRRPVGVTGPDGEFRLTTYAPEDGAPAGEYIVTIFWRNDAVPFDECACPDFSIHDRLGGSCANPATSPLRATVRPGSNEIVLQADLPDRGWNLPRRREVDKSSQPMPKNRSE